MHKRRSCTLTHNCRGEYAFLSPVTRQQGQVPAVSLGIMGSWNKESREGVPAPARIWFLQLCPSAWYTELSQVHEGVLGSCEFCSGL